jgi:superfamily II DNA helicase RecQ
MDLQDALSRLGASNLRGKQADAIDAINSGADVVYLFPTGTGKTLVYEACALCTEHATIVVSPLVGLLQQQSFRLADRGVGVLQAWDGKVRRLGNHAVKVVYTTPEQLADGSRLRQHLHSQRITASRLVVDEAHLVVQWDTFRFALQYMWMHVVCSQTCRCLTRAYFSQANVLRAGSSARLHCFANCCVYGNSGSRNIG